MFAYILTCTEELVHVVTVFLINNALPERGGERRLIARNPDVAQQSIRTAVAIAILERTAKIFQIIITFIFKCKTILPRNAKKYI